MNRKTWVALPALLCLGLTAANAQDSFGAAQQPFPGTAPGFGAPPPPPATQPGLPMPPPPPNFEAPPMIPPMGMQPIPTQPTPGQLPGAPGMPGGMAGEPPGFVGAPPAVPGGQQPGFTMPGQGQQTGGQAAPNDPLEALSQMERQDFGVPASSELHAGAFHGPTPNQIPGGQLITTKGLMALMQNQQIAKMVFDVLGGAERLPGAIPAVPASQPGTYQDQTQQAFGQYLNQATSGNREIPLVFYCLSTQCWMSYNAALRAIAMGYTNVLWYRGGIEAWKSAGLPTQR